VTEAAGVTEAGCEHDLSFDRCICSCGAMHYYCAKCGTRLGDCPDESSADTIAGVPVADLYGPAERK